MEPIDLSRVRTYPIAERRNLVHLNDLIAPESPPPPFESPELERVAEHVIEARRAGRPVIWMMGAHVIKSGLSRLVIDLMQRGVVTQVAGNGAVSIHDFELAMIGETSEHVPTGLEDGTFGMAEETGALMNRAVREGARDGLGYGAAVGRFIAEHPERFPHRDVSVLHAAYALGIPMTIHVTLGADIIHQHPAVDFAALGAASGLDFRLFTAGVSALEGGVYLNFGSAVTGAEVFLKALTIVRNLGHPVAHFCTANFDLRPLGDYRAPVGPDHPDYYYRPRKNVVNRPTSSGGWGYHVTGDHRVTIPNLYQRVRAGLGDSVCVQRAGAEGEKLPAGVAAALEALAARQPVLAPLRGELARAYRELARCFTSGGTLFLCGNGGSMADALHISGELLKSYARPRPLDARVRARLDSQPDGALLAGNLQPGLRAIVLGANLSLSSAVANDLPERDMNLAQELLALAHPGDVLLGLSTSGNARNVIYAAQVARALGLTVIVFTGGEGGQLAGLGDVVLRVPAARTDRAQELHVHLYHTLCEMLEIGLFGSNA